MSGHEQQQNDKPTRDYADLDIPISVVVKFGLWMLVLVAATFWGAVYMLRKLQATDTPGGATAGAPAFTQDRILPPEPHLLVNEKLTLDEYEARENQILTNYAWVDKSAGVARIPVDRAIELISERGLPARASK